MELFTYNHNILTDTLNGILAMDELNETIINSDITIALSHITSDSGNIYTSFKAELSDDDEVLLNTIISEHDGIVEDNSMPTKVKVIEESPNGKDKTSGKFQADSIKVIVPEGVGTYSTTISYPFYIGLLSATWFCNDVNYGDEASFYVSPDAIIGYTTQPLVSGSTEVYVNDTVIENVVNGYYISVGNDDYISVSNVDTVNNIITLSSPIPTEVNAGEYIKLRINVLSDFHFDGVGQMSLGQSKIGSALMPPNTSMKLEYVNNNGQSKKFSVLLEFMY